MTQISRDFAPPFSLIAPYFKTGLYFYILSIIFAFSLSTNIVHLNFFSLSWIHIVILGFIMMIIFGAMAQLLPVVLEVGHAFVDFFYIIRPLLSVGLILLILGFIYNPLLLPFGGLLLLLSMFIFSINLFFTLRKNSLDTLVVKIVKMSNIYLLFGVTIALIMSLSLSGLINIAITPLLKLHVGTLIGGYLSLSIMAIALILIPMFGLSHNFKEKSLHYAYHLMNAAIALTLLSSLFNSNILTYIATIIAMLSFGYFSYQIYLIHTTRVRKEYDIYTKSLIVAFSSLFLSFITLILYLLTQSDNYLFGTIWFFLLGFVGFFITAHLYKIVPFLVWFERFAPLVGKEKVPMLHDMLPKFESKAQLYYSSLGLLLVGISFIIQIDTLYYAGLSSFFVGALFLSKALFYMMNYGVKNENKRRNI